MVALIILNGLLFISINAAAARKSCRCRGRTAAAVPFTYLNVDLLQNRNASGLQMCDALFAFGEDPVGMVVCVLQGVAERIAHILFESNVELLYEVI